MIKFFIITIFVLLFSQPINADNWWHSKIKNLERNTFIDNAIKQIHSNCNCTGINFNKSLIEIQTSQIKVNKKFAKLFNKFLK